MVLIYFPFEHFCLFQAMGTFCLHQSIREIYDGECELQVLYIKPKICCVIIINETLVMKQIICTFRMPHEVIFFLTQHAFSLQGSFTSEWLPAPQQNFSSSRWIFFLNHSKNYLCWSSALIYFASTRSMPCESPVSRVNFTLLNNIYILKLENYLYLSTLAHLNHDTEVLMETCQFYY